MTLTQEGLKVKGSYRLQITEDGEIVGDSGWHTNQVVNLGFNDYLAQTLGGMGGSKVITHMALGTGTEPAAAGTALQHEIIDSTLNSRRGITAATSSTSKRLRLTATFGSANSWITTTHNISNIGLFNTSSVTVGTLFAGNTFASSSVATNQNVNASYDIDFS